MFPYFVNKAIKLNFIIMHLKVRILWKCANHLYFHLNLNNSTITNHFFENPWFTQLNKSIKKDNFSFDCKLIYNKSPKIIELIKQTNPIIVDNFISLIKLLKPQFHNAIDSSFI